MQRKGNIINRKSQMENLVTIGIDMGGSLWATAVYDWTEGKNNYYALKDKDSETKEERCFELVKSLVDCEKKVHVFYEAGRYGYWPARKFQDLGAEAHVLPINKLKVIMCGKVIKTDKLDAMFLGGLHPEDRLPEVYIPSVAEEGHRDGERELARLKKREKGVNSQLLALVERTELPTPKGHQSSRIWRKLIMEWGRGEIWAKLPYLMRQRFKSMIEELEFAEKQLVEWEKVIEKQMEADQKQDTASDTTATTIAKMECFKGISDGIARHLVWEIGDFMRFDGHKAFTSYFGITPSPFASGTMNREQGISKSGRKSLRKMAIEMAWMWYRWQPNSTLVKKWKDRLEQKGRSRRTAIVAMARQLLAALWQFVVHGKNIEGAIINKPLAA